MPSLQKALEKTLEAELATAQAKEAVVAIALRTKLPELTPAQAKITAKELLEHGTSTLPSESLFPQEDRSVLLTADELEAALAKYLKCVAKATTETTGQVIDELASSILSEMRENGSTVTAELATDRNDFVTNLNLVWGNALNRLELLINAVQEANIMFFQTTADEQRPKQSYRRFALHRVHLRACRAAHEILCLLRGGLADGANARWRTLHELSVIAMFLAEHGERVARRYLDHQVIEQRKNLRAYQLHCATLGQDAVEPEEAEKIHNEADRLIKRHGKAFGGDYGWATPYLKGRPANFAEIEASLRLAHWRPHYLLACQSVHAGARGCMYSIGALDDPMIACGPTIVGLGEPGFQCVQSLVLASVAMLTSQSVLDNVVMAQVISRMAGDVADAFVTSEQFLEDHLISLPNEFEVADE